MTQPSFTIIYEDDDLVAVNKPSGLLSIPDRFDAKLPSLKQQLSETRNGIFVIHRLDRDTSGIILFARNEEAHRFYSSAFEERKMTKKYLGIVHGRPIPPQGTIDKPIAHHPVVKGKMTVHRNGKPSVTHYRMLDSFGLHSLLQLEIETGRTHQIRVHLQDIGNPVVCDPLYGDGKPLYLSQIKKKFKLSRNQEEETPLLNRLGLHAHSLGFTTRSGNQVFLEAPLFRDMQAAVNQLRKNAGH